MEVAGSSPVIRSTFKNLQVAVSSFFMYNCHGDFMKIEMLRTKTDSGEETVTSLNLIAGLGVEGDKKAKGGDRQLTLADESSLVAYRADGNGLCVHRFMPNVATSGIDYSALKVGDRFTIGDIVIEISSTNKKCFEECKFVQNGSHCEIKHNCAFAKIICGGTITTGDEIIEG